VCVCDCCACSVRFASCLTCPGASLAGTWVRGKTCWICCWEAELKREGKGSACVCLRRHLVFRWITSTSLDLELQLGNHPMTALELPAAMSTSLGTTPQMEHGHLCVEGGECHVVIVSLLLLCCSWSSIYDIPPSHVSLTGAY